jgi:hypothetical protein
MTRFVVHNDAVEELKTSSENSNTRKGTKKWAALRNICEDMEIHEVQELDKFTITNKFCPL